MHIKLKGYAAALLGTLVLGFATAASATPVNLLNNGSFETGTTAGWTGDTSSVVIEHSGSSAGLNWTPEDGSYYARSGYGVIKSLSQTFSDKTGDTLQLSGWMQSENGTSPSYFGLQFDGAQKVQLSPAPQEGWTLYSATATATGSDTFTVQFENGPGWIGLDNFSVIDLGPPQAQGGTSVPEPLGAGFLVLGLLGAATRRRTGKIQA